MKAQPIIHRRTLLSENTFVEMTIWHLSAPVKGCAHRYKYRLAYVVNEVCVLRYDNEQGKGDHRHIGTYEQTVPFSDVDRLLADFMNDIRRWNDENSDS